MPVEQRSQVMNQAGGPDLRNHCPVCGHHYQAGENVLALDCLTFAAGPRSAAPGAGRDSGRKILLGHDRCVLPRLLTLLADFQPEARFQGASGDNSIHGSAFPEH